MRRVLILGATGSIGTTALAYIRNHKDQFIVTGLVANRSKDALIKLADEFDAPYLLMSENREETLSEFISHNDADIVLNGIAGYKGLYATIKTLEAGKDIALANKESVVMGSDVIFKLAKKNNAKIIPVDSEHSAIYHLLKGRDAEKLIITASGGPFRDRENLENVTIEEALNHPTWKMGKKITIDSATLANKGLEVIEASFLFGFASKDIEVVVHRQSVVHSMIYTKSGAIYAEMSPPDMTHPIITALSDENEDIRGAVNKLDFTNLTLTFERPNYEKFPLLKLAYNVLEKGGSYPIAYNASNEEAVYAFLDGKIRFTDIAKITEKTIDHDFSATSDSYEKIMSQDMKARDIALKEISCLIS